MIKRKITTVPPRRVPTKTSGLSSRIALILTAVSGIEVSKPKTKKDKANEEILNCLAILSTDLMIRLAPNQIVMKEIMYNNKLVMRLMIKVYTPV